MNDSLLNIRDLTITVKEAGKEKVLVDQINLNIPREKIVALVGGSGSGKTTTGLSILRLLPYGLNIKQGSIVFQGQDVMRFSQTKMRQLRGKNISMVFQEPLQALNPVFSIGYQISEVLQIHTDLSSGERRKRIIELFNQVGLPDPERMALTYPHQLSGGMRQRAMIAQAIAANPKLIIADEPTSNLDVTLQAKIIELFKQLKDELRLSILLISHDLGMVSHISDNIAVMTNGKIVEQGKTKDILNDPSHDYTKQLLNFCEI